MAEVLKSCAPFFVDDWDIINSTICIYLLLVSIYLLSSHSVHLLGQVPQLTSVCTFSLGQADEHFLSLPRTSGSVQTFAPYTIETPKYQSTKDSVIEFPTVLHITQKNREAISPC